MHYICHAEAKRFQPANITFDLLPPLEEELRKKIRDKKERHRIQCERALAAWAEWRGRIGSVKEKAEAIEAKVWRFRGWCE